MKILSLPLLVIMSFFLNACLFEEEKCSPTSEPLSQESLVTSSAHFTYCGETGWRQPMQFELFYISGNCTEVPSVKWETPEGTTNNQSEGSQGVFANYNFTQSGEICAEMVGADGDKICKPVKVDSEKIWGQTKQEFLSPSSGPRLVSMNINGRIFAGFGQENSWSEFDTLTWKWIPKKQIDKLKDFKAFGGWAYKEHGYLIGLNNVIYQYDVQNDSWIIFDQLPFNNISDLKIDPEPYGELTPYFSEIFNDKVYIGGGMTGLFYEYNLKDKSWNQLDSLPAYYYRDRHVFSLKGKIYAGQYIFDTKTKLWSIGKKDFTSPLSPPAIIGDVAYFGDINKMYSFDGETFQEIEFESKRNCFNSSPQTDFFQRSVTIGNLAIYPTFKGRKTHGSAPSNTLYFKLK